MHREFLESCREHLAEQDGMDVHEFDAFEQGCLEADGLELVCEQVIPRLTPHLKPIEEFLCHCRLNTLWTCNAKVAHLLV